MNDIGRAAVQKRHHRRILLPLLCERDRTNLMIALLLAPIGKIVSSFSDNEARMASKSGGTRWPGGELRATTVPHAPRAVCAFV